MQSFQNFCVIIVILQASAILGCGLLILLSNLKIKLDEYKDEWRTKEKRSAIKTEKAEKL